MKARTIKEAWAIADEIFPTDYNKDETASVNAGYDIYRSTIKNAWISDLGDRLEINLEDGKTVNIWIEEDEPTTKNHTETVITIQMDTHHGTLKNNATSHFETSLTLSQYTKLSDISIFGKEASHIIKTARKNVNKADWIYISISKAKYTFTSCADIKQTSFEYWHGSGNSITEEGVHLNPDERYTTDIAHDMWLTGKNIFDEITI